jgi:hypothetical protein
MAIQLSIAARNARLDSIETVVGVSAILQIWSGESPANCSAAATGTKLFTSTLASDWAANAANGSKSLNNLPLSGTAIATGTAGYFRIMETTATTCHMQGTVTESGLGGDMTIDNADILNGQPVNITGFIITDGNP